MLPVCWVILEASCCLQLFLLVLLDNFWGRPSRLKPWSESKYGIWTHNAGHRLLTWEVRRRVYCARTLRRAQIQNRCSAIDWKLGVFLISVLMASRKQLKCHSLHFKSILIWVFFFAPSPFIFVLGRLYFKLILLLVDLLRGSAPVTYIENLTSEFSWCKWQCFKLSCPPCNYLSFLYPPTQT